MHFEILKLRRKIAFALLAAAVISTSNCTAFSKRFRPNENANAPSTSAATAPARDSPQSVHLMLGNPSNAATDQPDNYILVGDTSAISYNETRGTPNWVSWWTTKADLGERLERPDFQPDPHLPGHFRRIGYYDYSGSGYDRGHILPSADRFGNAAMNAQTFYMSNIVPQTGALNQFPWEKMESYSRSLAWKGNDVYTIAGIYGEKGRLRRKVTVPTNCWKIIVVLRLGSALKDIDERTRVIAVDMPNINGIENDGWEKYRTSVSAIEKKTGYNFLSALPAELQEKLENRVDDNWSRPLSSK
jgi:endonuclease G